MKLPERHRKILEILKSNGNIAVNELSEMLKVSSVTIRKDLGILEDQQLLFRSHGGALPLEPYIANRHIQEKIKVFPEEKKRIGAKATELLIPGDAIIIGSGTTVQAFAQCINPKSSLTVVTSAMNVATALVHHPQIEIFQLGGFVRHTSNSVVGNYAESILTNFSCSKLFLGVDGIDLRYGFSTTNAMEAQINRAMLKAAQETIILADSSKFGRRGFGKICDLDSVSQIITDTGVSHKTIQELEKHGILVTTV